MFAINVHQTQMPLVMLTTVSSNQNNSSQYTFLIVPTKFPKAYNAQSRKENTRLLEY